MAGRQLVAMRIAATSSVCLSAALLAGLAHGEERKPMEALSRFRAGLAARDSAQVETAIREFREAVRLDPLLGPAYYELGRALETRQRYPEAVQALQAACDAFRKTARLEREAATRAEERGKVATLDDVDYHELDHNRRYPWAYVFEPGRTRALDIAKDRHAGRAGPVPAEVFLALGSAQHRLGALAEAERAYLQAIEADPDLGEAHNNLAVVYLQTGRAAEAEREVARSEQTGFPVSPGLRQEIAARRH
jgi:tetratricopeptide (TPR) repeat protein